MATTSVQVSKSEVEIRVNEALRYLNEFPEAKLAAVARQFNVPRTRLQRRKSGITARIGYPAANTKL
ncbi:hypothetical protein E5D57_003428 [Metarhizium anisopliae]|nr:hypothetical protein E5D57_003428 [Metarhizium anisopliae]